MNDYTSVTFWRYSLPEPVQELAVGIEQVEMFNESDSDNEHIRGIAEAEGITTDKWYSYRMAS
jgi:hypothetical protein